MPALKQKAGLRITGQTVLTQEAITEVGKQIVNGNQKGHLFFPSPMRDLESASNSNDLNVSDDRHPVVAEYHSLTKGKAPEKE